MSGIYSVLVIEDERIVARDLQEALNDLGYDAFAVAASADEAMARAQERRPDVALLDIRLKGNTDGITTAAMLRERFDVPVIFLTAHADDATLERATKVEPEGYLVKPVKPGELRAAIELSRHRALVERRAREAEASLRASEQRYRLIVETAHEGIAITDSGGSFTYTNRRMEELFGYGAGELLGRHFNELVHREATADSREVFEQRRQGLSSGVEWKLKRKDGRSLWGWVESNPIHDDGSFVGVLSMVTDITEEKLAREAERALQAKMILADRLSSIGLLAAGVGHEINNPLTYILWNLEMLARELPKSKVPALEKMVREARDGAERVRRIVKGLKTFTRGEEGETRVIDIRAIVDMSVEMASNEIRHRARIETQYDEVPAVEADEAQLGQVFLNLLVNAAQSIPVGRANDNEIRVVTGTAPDGRAFVEIRDTGAGMPDDVKRRVFEPFFTTREVGAGTGLGLSVCHGIVVSLGGEISCESLEGRGSTFRVVLPRAESGQLPDPFERSERVAERRRRILIVDDDIGVGRALSLILADHDVTVATDGKKAIEQIEATAPFDMVFCDLMMPVMTGMDVFAVLTAQRSPLVDRFVFITGGAFTPAARKFLDSVPNKTLEKPFDVDAVRSVVDTIAP